MTSEGRWLRSMAGWPAPLSGAVLGVALLLASATLALVSAEDWWILMVLLTVAVVGFVLLHRSPLVGIGIWLAVSPLFQIAEEGGIERRIYWLVHRALPFIVLGVLVLMRLTGLRRERYPRLGWPEVLMLAYAATSIVSIMYLSDRVLATTYLFYDRVLVAMALYLIVRLIPPSARDYRKLIPLLVFLLASQALFGALSWFAPELLPDNWLNRVGTRTTGSLRHPNVYGTTVLVTGALLLHLGLSTGGSRRRRQTFLALFVVALALAFFTFSRASWLAAVVVVLVMIVLYPRALAGLAVAMVPVLAIVLAIGMSNPVTQLTIDRLQSEESALSRLPVAVAAVRMFAEKPVSGWGYGNFDRFDRQFQSSVGDLFVPDKDHASHNLYLTLASEQGVIGLISYLGPALILLALTPRAMKRLPASGIVSRKLLVVLWLVPASHFVVNNFSNMRVVFGLGLYWLSLGLIAGLVVSPGQGLSGPDEVTRGLAQTGKPVRNLV